MSPEERELRLALLHSAGLVGEESSVLVEALALRLKPERFESGESVVTSGELGDRAFVIRQGEADVVAIDAIGAVAVLARLGPTESFGEIALLAAGRRTATVRARTALELYSLHRGDFEQVILNDATLRGRMHERVRLLLRRAFLKCASPFSGMGPQTLLRIAGSLREVLAANGQAVVREAEEADALYLVRSGTLEVTRRGRRLREMGAGDCFGEIGLLRGGKRTSTVTAHGEAELYVLHRDEFELCVAEDAALRARLAEIARIRDASTDFVHAGFPDPVTSLMPFLDRQRRRFQGRALAGGTSLAVLLIVAAMRFGSGPLTVVAILAAQAVAPTGLLLYVTQSQFLASRTGRVLAMFAFGGALGAGIGAALDYLIPAWTASSIAALAVPLVVALAEESAKLVPLIVVLRDRRFRFQIDGLIFGVAVGMGFTFIENAVHALRDLPVLGWNSTICGMFLQALIAPFSHGAWTGVVGAAIWSARSSGRARARHLAQAFGTSVALHALWDLEAVKIVSRELLPTVDPALVFAGVWQPLVGIVTLFVAREAFWRGLVEQGHSLLALDPELAARSEAGDGVPCGVCSQVSMVGTHYCARCGAILGDGRVGR